MSLLINDKLKLYVFCDNCDLNSLYFIHLPFKCLFPLYAYVLIHAVRGIQYGIGCMSDNLWYI